jgi:flagellar basal-body rod modification protein FlgD
MRAFEKPAIKRIRQMSTINGVGRTYADTATNSSTSSNSSNSSTTSNEKEVTSADFMKLLIAQLQNQDPTNPMDNQQFVAQLATFNSLEQLVSINDNVAKLVSNSSTDSTDTSSSSS